MTQCVTSCMTQNVGAIFFSKNSKKRAYDTKVYDTKCTTLLFLLFRFELLRLLESRSPADLDGHILKEGEGLGPVAAANFHLGKVVINFCPAVLRVEDVSHYL